jgi:hypothetical protein
MPHDLATVRPHVDDKFMDLAGLAASVAGNLNSWLFWAEYRQTILTP